MGKERLREEGGIGEGGEKKGLHDGKEERER
jgi:hypothetical protein